MGLPVITRITPMKTIMMPIIMEGEIVSPNSVIPQMRLQKRVADLLTKAFVRGIFFKTCCQTIA